MISPEQNADKPAETPPPKPTGVVYRRAPAKINLGLFIQGRRADGYHLLETLYHPAPLADELAVSIEDFEPACVLRQSGRPIPGDPRENLILRAYDLLKADFPELAPVRIHLHKRIPAGAGLGGGSSDAAAMLSALNELFELGQSLEQLSAYAALLGADVPFFLHQEPMLASGTGTTLRPFPMELPLRIQLLTPPIHSDTAEAYRSLVLEQCHTATALADVLERPYAEWREVLANDFERPVFARYPQLQTFKEHLYEQGAIYAAMSGSGSALFGLFPE